MTTAVPKTASHSKTTVGIKMTPEERAASIKKMEAEARAADAAAEESLASAREHDALAESARREQQMMEHQIESARIESLAAGITLDQLQRQERFLKVSDLLSHRYTYDDIVTDRSVKQCMNTLLAWSRDAPGCAVDIIINSPGGDIIAGMALVDFITDLRSKGHHVTTTALGMAGSMAALLLQCGTERVMGRNAVLLIHQGSLSAAGSYGEVTDQMKLMDLLHARVLDLLEDRARPLNSKTTKAFIKGKWERKDWWLTADQAQVLGFCDRVL